MYLAAEERWGVPTSKAAALESLATQLTALRGRVTRDAKRAAKIEAFLKGHRRTAEDMLAAQELVAKEISPIADLRASKEYRLHMAQVMLERGLKTAAARLAGKGPAYGVSVL